MKDSKGILLPKKIVSPEEVRRILYPGVDEGCKKFEHVKPDVMRKDEVLDHPLDFNDSFDDGDE